MVVVVMIVANSIGITNAVRWLHTQTTTTIYQQRHHFTAATTIGGKVAVEW